MASGTQQWVPSLRLTPAAPRWVPSLTASLWAAEEEPDVIELEVFNMLDTDGDGHLSLKDMAPLLRELNPSRKSAVAAQMKRCRTPQAGFSKGEFAAAFREEKRRVLEFYQDRFHETIDAPAASSTPVASSTPLTHEWFNTTPPSTAAQEWRTPRKRAPRIDKRIPKAAPKPGRIGRVVQAEAWTEVAPSPKPTRRRGSAMGAAAEDAETTWRWKPKDWPRLPEAADCQQTARSDAELEAEALLEAGPATSPSTKPVARRIHRARRRTAPAGAVVPQPDSDNEKEDTQSEVLALVSSASALPIIDTEFDAGEESEIIPRALAGNSAAETLAGLAFDREFGGSWDWPLSRQEKKDRLLMINNIVLRDELEELRHQVDVLTKEKQSAEEK